MRVILDNILEHFDVISENVVNEVFYLLFNDKIFLFQFNLMLAEYIRKINDNNCNQHFDTNHNVTRCSYIPEWLKKAVYFRDNGICQHCGKDLSCYVRINEEREKQYDHIIP